MDIRQFRLVVKARDFDASCRFYGEVLALPRLRSWDHDDGRGAIFQAGSGAVELHGQARAAGGSGDDEAYRFQGPKQKLSLTLVVPSAEEAYEELIFREKNIPGGLRRDDDGVLVFETHDPDGVKVFFREEEEG